MYSAERSNPFVQIRDGVETQKLVLGREIRDEDYFWKTSVHQSCSVSNEGQFSEAKEGFVAPHSCASAACQDCAKDFRAANHFRLLLFPVVPTISSIQLMAAIADGNPIV